MDPLDRVLLIQNLWKLYYALTCAGSFLGLGVVILLFIRKQKAAALLSLFGFMSLGVLPLLYLLGGPIVRLLVRLSMNGPDLLDAWTNFQAMGYPIVGAIANIIGFILLAVAFIVGVKVKKKEEPVTN